MKFSYQLPYRPLTGLLPYLAVPEVEPSQDVGVIFIEALGFASAASINSISDN